MSRSKIAVLALAVIVLLVSPGVVVYATLEGHAPWTILEGEEWLRKNLWYVALSWVGVAGSVLAWLLYAGPSADLKQFSEDLRNAQRIVYETHRK